MTEFYEQARATVDKALLRLDCLTPLRGAANAKDIEAMRTMIRSKLNELVNELAMTDGPRVERVNSVFDTLLGKSTTTEFDPAQVEGKLKLLRDRFGVSPTRVNTISEEQNLTNFLVLVNYVNSLRQLWNSRHRKA